MKKLLVLMFVCLCAQSFCMYGDAVQGGNTPFVRQENFYARINQCLARLPNDDQGGQVSQLRQDLLDVASALQAALEFDRNYRGSLGERNYRHYNIDLSSIIPSTLINDDNADRGEIIRYIVGGVHQVASGNIDRADMPGDAHQAALVSLYCVCYSEMCDIGEEFMSLVEDIPPGDLDVICIYARHLREGVDFASSVIIGLGTDMLDPVQLQ